MPKKIIFTEEQIEEIIRMYNLEFKNILTIARKFSCSTRPILNILRKRNINTGIRYRKNLLHKNGLIKNIGGKKMLDESKIIEMYKNEFKSIKVIGKIFKCSSTVIKRILRENNVTIFPIGFHNRGKGRRRINLKDGDVIDYYLNKGKSTKQIARIYNCSDVSIINVLKRNNVKRFPAGFFTKGKPSWCSGLTKETDERVRKIAESLINHPCYKDPVRSKKISDSKIGKPSWCSGLKGEEFLKHYNSGNVWNTGLNKESDKRIEGYAKKKEGHPCYKDPIRNKKLSDQRRGVPNPKVGETLRRKYASGELMPTMLGKKHTDEVRKKMSIDKIKRFKEGRMPKIWKNNTSIEIKLQGFLKELNIDFETNKFMKIRYPYHSDIFIPYLNLVLEADGDFWHANPSTKNRADWRNLTLKQRLQKILDFERTNQLEEQGFKVLRLWETDIKKMTLDDFKEIINNYKPEPPQILVSNLIKN